MPRLPRSSRLFVSRSRPPSPPAANRGTDVFPRAHYLLLAAAVAACGCSSKKIEGRKTVFPAHGQLLVDGQPPKGALLVLHPVDPAVQAEHPYGNIQPDGSFALSTYQGCDGAPAGDYVATVEWRVPRHAGDEGPWPNGLPERYAKAATSGLRVHIAQGANELPPIFLQR